MNSKVLVIVGVVLALSVMACGLPSGAVQLKSGPMQTQTISVPLPADTSKPVDVSLTLGAADVTAGVGAAKLVEGSVQYNVPEYQPVVTSAGNQVEIKQGPSGIKGLPPSDMVNKWSLKFNSSVPMNLTMKGGALNGTWDLGGLHLQSLTWEEGASKTDLSFNAANPEKMSLFAFTTGVSTAKLTGLANLNFARMTFQSGVGNYTLDFGGKLKQSATVEVKSGVSDVTIVVPSGTAARIAVKGGVSNIKTVGSWSASGSTYTAGNYDTAEVKLDITVDMGLGQLTLDTH
jgi:N-terminal domain of toast_rack, DUF2154